ncbi:unnamed protein product [Caenorhabditis auriculariae]|uniref:Ras-associating domain-containing protein n=1 Tax=Caenorhabditis auriculariae TaxID=2777116 RepID=A0A8S1HWM0_9PELO|nr:unnamed protein product [Caenorhabditis auriculariae]
MLSSYNAYKRRQQSAEWQLDELLEELEALETQLNTSNGGDQLLLGMSSALPTSSSAHDQLLRAKDSAVSKPVAHHHHHQQPATSTCSSPDGDSAFGDSSSTESARCRDSSAFSSNESCRDSLNTPSPTQTSPRNGELSADELKAQRIRLALEKMKEAKVARILVKFFGEGGVPLQLLIDERWTVAETLRQLADKNHMTLMEDHCIVEEFPDLHIQRVYEDHENVVENISMWVQDSPNKLHFIRRPDKYSFIYRPEMYLVTEKTSHIEVPSGTVWKQDVKQKFVREFFTNETVGKKASKDLTCLMSMHSSQIYTGINWEKKYKSPTPWCISIKLTKLQIKNSQYIKYICADDELTFQEMGRRFEDSQGEENSENGRMVPRGDWENSLS